VEEALKRPAQIHPKDLSVQAYAKHRCKSEFKDKPTFDTLKQWKIIGGILPYQGITIYWSPDRKENENNIIAVQKPHDRM
jgi:DNA gyrase inhibitor GyrI